MRGTAGHPPTGGKRLGKVLRLSPDHILYQKIPLPYQGGADVVVFKGERETNNETPRGTHSPDSSLKGVGISTAPVAKHEASFKRPDGGSSSAVIRR